MLTSPNAVRLFKRTAQQFSRIWQQLTEPAAALKDPQLRRRSRLLSSLLLLCILSTLLAPLPFYFADAAASAYNARVFFVSYGILLAVMFAYILNRRGHYRSATLITVGVTTLEMWGSVIWFGPVWSNITLAFLYLLIPTLLTTVLISAWAAAILSILDVIGIWLLQLIAPQQLTILNLVNTVVLFGLLAIVIIVEAHLRDRAQAQIERQSLQLTASEQRFRALIENSSDVIALIDVQGTFLYQSPSAERVLGYSLDKRLGQNVFELIHPEDFQRANDQLTQLLQMPGSSVSAVLRYRHQNGEWRWLEFTASNLLGNPAVAAIVINYRDISERKRAEEALMFEQSLMNALMNHLPDYVYFKDLASRFIRINQALARQFELNDPAKGVGKSDFDFLPKEQARLKFEQEQEIIRTGQPLLNVEDPDGYGNWGLTTKLPLRDENGAIIGTFGISHDITELKRWEDVLASERNLLHTLIDNLPDHIYAKDAEGRFILANIAVARHMGATQPDELIGKSDFDFYPPDLAEQFHADEQVLIQSGQSVLDHEESTRDPEGRPKWILTTKVILNDKQGENIGLVGIGRDITERKQTEEKLARSLSLVRATLDSTADGILAVDEYRKVTVCNRRFVELWRIPDSVLAAQDDQQLLGFVIEQLKDPQSFLAKVEEMYNQSDTESFDLLEFEDGRIFERYSQPQQVGNHIVGRVWSFRDITEAKRAEEALRQTAIQNQQLYHTADRRERELAALNEISQAISDLDVPRCLQAVATHAQSLMQADLGRVFIAEPDGLHLQAASGFNSGQAGSLVLPAGQGLCGWAAQHHEVTYSLDTLADPRYVNTIGRTHSEVATPLIYQDEMIGVLDVQWGRLNAFTPNDVELLGRMASQATTAIRNARLFAAELRSRQINETLFKVATVFHATESLDDMLLAVLDIAREAVPFASASITLRDPLTNRFFMRAQRDTPNFHLLAKRFDNFETFAHIRQMMATHRPVIVADAQTDPDWVWVENSGDIRAWLGAPLLINREVAGFLMFNANQPNFYTGEHLRLTEAVAQQIGLVLDNAQLFNETRRQAEREKAINTITNKIRSSMNLDEIMQTTVNELGQTLDVSRCLIRLGDNVNAMSVACEFVQPIIPPLGKGNTVVVSGVRDTLQARQTLALNDTTNVEAADEYQQLGIRAVLATPITARDDLLGMLVFHECISPRHWRRDEIDLVEAVATQVGVAFANARLYTETRRQLGELAILHTTAIAIAGRPTMEEAVQQVAQSVQAVFERARVAVMLIDPETNTLVIRANTGISNQVAQSVHIKLGQGITGWVAETGQPVLLKDVTTDPRHIAIANVPSRSEVCVPLRSGAQIIGVLNVESAQLNAFDDHDLRLLTTLGHNVAAILENIRLLEEVRAANNRLQELDRLKSQFLASMSHELRTPLNSIIGFSEVLADGLAGELTADQREYIGNIHISGKHLLALINDVLDLSKMQAGRMTLDWQLFDLQSVVLETRAILLPMIERKHQHLIVDIPPDLPPTYADPFRLKQILINLLSNAHKFTPKEGQLTLRVRWAAEQALLFSVSDTGRGIPPAEQALIFEEFRRIENPDVFHEEGTGLGLSITQRLVNLHGGRIWVESAGVPDLGSTFYFTLPLAQNAPDQASSQPVDRVSIARPGWNGSHRTVLIIEDDRQFSDLLALYLRQLGYDTRQRYTGLSAMAAITEQPPDLITLDLMLPDRDGWSILHEIRSTAELCQTAILIVSALDPSSTGLDHGPLDYLMKPLVKSELIEAVQRLNPPGPDQKVRILAIDDDLLVLELLKAMLVDTEFEIGGEADANEAFEQIKREPPDLVILDLLMPVFNGFEFLKVLRSDPATRDLPVLILSAKTLTPGERADLAASAQAVLSKNSLHRESLVAEIRRIEQLRTVLADPATHLK